MGKRGPQRKPLEARLLFKRSIVGDCWIWKGHKNSMGYGVLSTGHIGQKYVHRLAYELWVAPIGDLNVCHSCDKPLCFNPKHLWLGTQKDNIRDALSKGRCRNKVFWGEDHGRSKLTREAVKEIRSTYIPRKVSRVSLARKFGVDRTCIDKVLSGKIWPDRGLAFLKIQP